MNIDWGLQNIHAFFFGELLGLQTHTVIFDLLITW